ncbi:protein jagged-1b-like [Acanthaster planci]|uniref:Protein jagged-1b-like n=1 Tax=Acanthaster planci TaxID=133434 RepID=A0A8B7YRX6_ACAPL|nr:protein jagged-1b-like [Acanthaster planci]
MQESSAMAKPCAGFDFFWLLLLWVMVTFAFGHQCNPFHKTMYVAENRALQGFAYARMRVRSRAICGRDCRMDERCKSFNFNDNKMCELNLATRREHPGNFTATPGSVYYDEDEHTPRYSVNATNDFTDTGPCNSNPCKNGGTCREQLGNQGSFRCECAPGFKGTCCEDKPSDCRELYSRGIRQNAVYTIYPLTFSDGLEVYCDMEFALGGTPLLNSTGETSLPTTWTMMRIPILIVQLS